MLYHSDQTTPRLKRCLWSLETVLRLQQRAQTYERRNCTESHWISVNRQPKSKANGVNHQCAFWVSEWLRSVNVAAKECPIIPKRLLKLPPNHWSTEKAQKIQPFSLVRWKMESGIRELFWGISQNRKALRLNQRLWKGGGYFSEAVIEASSIKIILFGVSVKWKAEVSPKYQKGPTNNIKSNYSIRLRFSNQLNEGFILLWDR